MDRLQTCETPHASTCGTPDGLGHRRNKGPGWDETSARPGALWRTRSWREAWAAEANT